MPRGRQDGPQVGGADRLVDRALEFHTIQGVLDGLLSGSGGTVWIEGAAGLGKTRLLDEAARLAAAQGIQVFRARAREGERQYSFALVLQLFEAHLAARGPRERRELLSGAAGLADALFADSPVDAAGKPDFAYLHGIYWLVVNIARRAPVLLCVDDVQWADDPSARFLRYLAERLDGLPVGLLLAGRPPLPGTASTALDDLRVDQRVRHRTLRPLDPAGVAEVIRGRLPEADDAFTSACADTSGGNPFHVHEILVEVDTRGIPPTATSGQMLRDLGAATISRIALIRLLRLDAVCRRVAEATAVWGDGAPLRRVAGLAGLDLDEAARAVDVLAAEGITGAGEPVRFVHSLIATSVYDDIPAKRRSLAHREAARMLFAEDAPAESVAAHLVQAPGAAEEWAVTALLRAARRVRAHGDAEAATRYLQRACAEPPGPDHVGTVLAELGAAELATGSPASVGHLRDALRRSADPTDRAHIGGLLGRALIETGDTTGAVEAFDAGLDDAAGAPEALTALLGTYLSAAAYQPALRQRAFARADRLLPQLPRDATPSYRLLLACLAMRAAQEARPHAEVAGLAERAWDGGALVGRRGVDDPAWLMVVWALALAEMYERVREVTTAVRSAAQQAGSLDSFAAASYFRGYAALRCGDLAEAQADAAQIIEAGGPHRNGYDAVAQVILALVQVERGELAAARAALPELPEAGRAWMLVPWTLHAQGRIALAEGRPARALELFTDAGDWLETSLAADHSVLPWQADAGHAALALGRPEAACELVAPVERLSGVGVGVALANALRVRALAEGGERGIALLRESVSQLAHTYARLDHAYALADLGAALRRAGHVSEARAPLREALDHSQRCGAQLLADRVRDELAAAGVRPRRTAVTGLDALTPSEARIARLAAAGQTNNEIAQALFVTSKTVEYHLRHVFQKLSISRRGELEAVVGRGSAVG